MIKNVYMRTLLVGIDCISSGHSSISLNELIGDNMTCICLEAVNHRKNP